MKAYFAIFGATILTAVACGARSGLDVPPPPRIDAGPDAEDAGPDVVDAPPDVVDAPPDVPVVNECQDAGTTFIYLISEQNDLVRFYPPDMSIVPIGTIVCDDPKGGTPFSMAVDRTGIAYVVFDSGNLFRVSTLTASCAPTAYQITNFGAGDTFGMGFSADVGDPGETLFIASDDPSSGPTGPELLGTIDVKTFKVGTVGKFPGVIGSAELSGTGDGKLYGFGVDDLPPIKLALLEIDRNNAGILSNTPITVPGQTTMNQLQDWAFAFWGGDFYFFTAVAGSTTIISRYHPGDAAPTFLQQISLNITGAGVSTCAPQQ